MRGRAQGTMESLSALGGGDILLRVGITFVVLTIAFLFFFCKSVYFVDFQMMIFVNAAPTDTHTFPYTHRKKRKEETPSSITIHSARSIRTIEDGNIHEFWFGSLVHIAETNRDLLEHFQYVLCTEAQTPFRPTTPKERKLQLLQKRKQSESNDPNLINS